MDPSQQCCGLLNIGSSNSAREVRCRFTSRLSHMIFDHHSLPPAARNYICNCKRIPRKRRECCSSKEDIACCVPVYANPARTFPSPLRTPHHSARSASGPYQPTNLTSGYRRKSILQTSLASLKAVPKLHPTAMTLEALRPQVHKLLRNHKH
ncbi:hypothetical protein K491DRAFT_692547 [Lophiostoma macrostomum CBS 122681]|uniref:Uncharacterized protein n=1 Tax=Lophiostoma macrostomum CBS 122681 TaxID=1314788 RepID=A0A6A6T7C8_9PLEO|nr:hypothetical protein K491DRAFT_692547 [Lophiostoma macrostomum CBS 122681]